MTDLDALALALLGYPRRRLLGALVRHWTARAIPESDDLPPRDDGEAFLVWACRCAGHAADAAAEADRLRHEAARLVRAGAAAGQRVVTLGSSDYPTALSTIPDPPPVLWLRGALAALHAPRVVAVVGARAASRQGLAIAAAIGGELAAAGIVVVSGLARGVDTAAHRAALDAGGCSIAVLGSGLDRVYPAEHHGAGRRARRARRGGQRMRARRAAAAASFPAAQSHHQRARRGHRGGRGVGEERVAHHRRGGARPGPRGDGRARPGGPGPASWRARAAARRRHAGGARRGRDDGAGLGHPGRGCPRALRSIPPWPPNSASIRQLTSSTPMTCAPPPAGRQPAPAPGWARSRSAGAIQRVGGGRFVGSRTRVLT